jgi:hypothetical protein
VDRRGLSTVNAAESLLAPFDMSTSGGIATRDSKRHWPLLAGREDADLEKRARGIELGYLALSGATREYLQAEGERGARPTDGLAQAVSLPFLAGSFSEEYGLWLSSFSSEPAPSKAKRLLKA